GVDPAQRRDLLGQLALVIAGELLTTEIGQRLQIFGDARAVDISEDLVLREVINVTRLPQNAAPYEARRDPQEDISRDAEELRPAITRILAMADESAQSWQQRAQELVLEGLSGELLGEL